MYLRGRKGQNPFAFLFRKSNDNDMKIVDLSQQNTVLNRFLVEIRDKEIQKDQMRFRRNIERIGEVMAYEISKELAYAPLTVPTLLGEAVHNVPADKVVLSTILRAGLPLHTGFHNYFDTAENAFVSAYRKYTDDTHFDVHVEYLASPRLDGKVVLLVDTMLATGCSTLLAYKALLTKGVPAKLVIASVIASREAVEFVKANFPDDTILYCAAIDPVLNDHYYIVPGLGDAGDLCFGEKE